MRDVLTAFRHSKLSRPAVLYGLSFGIGLFSMNGHPYLMPFALLFPALFLLTKTPLERMAVPMGYYGAFLVTIFPGGQVFFGHDFNPIGVFALWVLSCTMLSLPWALLCNNNRRRLFWAVPLAMLIEIFPPFGLFGVGHPLSATGILVPHTAWYGLVSVFLASGFIAAYPKIFAPIILTLTIVSAAYVHDKPIPYGWVAVNTRLGPTGDYMQDYHILQYVQHTLNTTTKNSRVVVLPESIMQWNNTQDLFLASTIHRLNDEHRTAIIGATSLVQGAPERYRNVAIIRGEVNDVFDQRIPIPVTMWNPIDPTKGVSLNLTGKATAPMIDGQRPAIIICYEQMLMIPILESLYARPTVIVGMTNDYWAVHTWVPQMQSSTLKSWGRLFNLPVVNAINY
ncbi:MAG: hypothetical protein WCF54_17665 [Terracidiphilus sp.]